MGNHRRVYIMKFKLYESSTQYGDFIFKIGVSSGKSSVDRALQIQRAHFMKYRFFPFMSIKRDRPCTHDEAFEIETGLHRKFKQYQFYHDKPIDGKEEFFAMPEHELLKAYDELLPLKGRE